MLLYMLTPLNYLYNRDTMNHRGRTEFRLQHLGWKMNIEQWNRCMRAVAGALFY